MQTIHISTYASAYLIILYAGIHIHEANNGIWNVATYVTYL